MKQQGWAAYGFFEMLLLIVLWVFPIIMFMRNYLKMNREDQAKFKKELRNPVIIFGAGFPIMGFLLLISGTISGVKLLNQVGTFMLIGSCFIFGIAGWIKKERSFWSNTSFIFWGIILTALYIYFD